MLAYLWASKFWPQKIRFKTCVREERGHSKSTFVVERREGVLKKGTKTNRERGEGSSLYVRSLCKKITWFLKQQAEFFLMSCLTVAKSFSVLSLVQHIKLFLLLKKRRHYFHLTIFLSTWKYFYCHCIYNCVKIIDLLCWVDKKINSFFSFHSLIFKANKRWGRGICKTNRDGQYVF